MIIIDRAIRLLFFQVVDRSRRQRQIGRGRATRAEAYISKPRVRDGGLPAGSPRHGSSREGVRARY